MLKTMKRSAIAAAIALHFFFIISVVTHLHDWLAQRPVLVVIPFLENYYSAVTFTNRNFGFFAPSVTSDWNVSLALTDANGLKQNLFFKPANREMQVRMYSLMGHFAETDTNMDLFARSWAVKAMNENPNVVRVDVEVTQNYIPTMSEYRRGRRIEPKPFYRTTFELAKRAARS
jgi:hypothetical protein